MSSWTRGERTNGPQRQKVLGILVSVKQMCNTNNNDLFFLSSSSGQRCSEFYWCHLTSLTAFFLYLRTQPHAAFCVLKLLLIRTFIFPKLGTTHQIWW
ncbi:hypothetical protein VNO78_22833 [Psophocarpus tetragonolobus]|uniref:Uncharacterized protein n=1 Tax=Psophocarpus tetragonolobus TaxID=3891 RepID=A0AAN9XCV0_PSOTE